MQDSFYLELDVRSGEIREWANGSWLSGVVLTRTRSWKDGSDACKRGKVGQSEPLWPRVESALCEKKKRRRW